MDSTGGFLDALITGIIVATKEMNTAIATIKPTVIGLNCMTEIPISCTKYLSKKN